MLLIGWNDTIARSLSSGLVEDVLPLGREPSDEDYWTPVQNEDGSWSLRGNYGRYLSISCPGMRACTLPHNKLRERFWVESDEEGEFKYSSEFLS